MKHRNQGSGAWRVAAALTLATALLTVSAAPVVAQAASRQTLAGQELVASTLAHPGLPGAGLLGASCASRSLCFAVGAFDDGGFLERWNGRSWSRVATHRDRELALLGGISCSSHSFCLVVGGSKSNLTFAERWNGRSLSSVRTVSPPSGGEDLLNSVSCLSARDCWAVGAVHAATNSPRPLVEHWNGRRFSLAAKPSAAGLFTSVSCPGAQDCWAAGMFDLVEHFNGRRWRAVRLPVRFGRWDATAVSCPAISECWILGTSSGGRRPPQPVAVQLRHGSWHRMPIPNGPQEASNFIEGVGCASASDCWAVGQSIRGSRAANSAPFAEEWDGSTWQIAKVTGRPGRNSFFNAVACASPGRCVAVGTTANGGPTASPMVAISRPAL